MTRVLPIAIGDLCPAHQLAPNEGARVTKASDTLVIVVIDGYGQVGYGSQSDDEPIISEGKWSVHV